MTVVVVSLASLLEDSSRVDCARLTVRVRYERLVAVALECRRERFGRGERDVSIVSMFFAQPIARPANTGSSSDHPQMSHQINLCMREVD